jgi:hypothetical protein
MTISLHRSCAGIARARLRDPSTGGAAVEFALVLPIFMLLVMGALDYGYFFFTDQVVAGAAREGARAGSMDTPANAVTAAKNAAYAYMKGNGIDCDTKTNDCIHVNEPTPPPPLTINGLTINLIKVDIHFPFTSLTGYTSIVIPAQIKGYAEARW